MPDTAYTAGFRAGFQACCYATYEQNIVAARAPAHLAAVRDDIQRHLNGLPQGRAELDAWLVGVATGGRVGLDRLDTMPGVRWAEVVPDSVPDEYGSAHEDHIVRGSE